MNAVLRPAPGGWPQPAPERRIAFAAMTERDLPTVLAVEKSAYAHPWSLGNFRDTLAAGHQAQMLVAEAQGAMGAPLLPGGQVLLGYVVAMRGVDEVHLLNLAVAPAHQRQGWARFLLEALALWSRGQGALWLWLEVRRSNAPARALYQREGFKEVGVRRHYYPNGRTEREDAIVMSRALWPVSNAGAAP